MLARNVMPRNEWLGMAHKRFGVPPWRWLCCAGDGDTHIAFLPCYQAGTQPAWSVLCLCMIEPHV